MLFSGPVVQIVSNVMALTTFREALVHALGVWQTMTIRTLGHSLVLVSMTGCARDLAMLGGACGKSRKDGVMTCSAEL